MAKKAALLRVYRVAVMPTVLIGVVADPFAALLTGSRPLTPIVAFFMWPEWKDQHRALANR
jgi:GPH family glycoside/pentoside/hexuronide:cation symporter